MLSQDQQDFLAAAIAAAQEAGAKMPAWPPALGPVTVAQCLLESNWGRSQLSRIAHNYFGVKARAGEPSITLKTREYVHDTPVVTEAAFATYDSMAASFTAHAQLICERTWKSGEKIYAAALAHPNDPIAFAHALTGVYATDPAYGTKLERIMRAYELLARFGFPEEPADAAS